jgi:hypothetical protein
LRLRTFAFMTTMSPEKERRSAYTPAALDRAADDLATRSAGFALFRAYYQWSLRGSYAQRAFLLATSFIAAKAPALRPFLQPIVVLQAVFIVLSWLGPPLIDVFLCLDQRVRKLIPPWRRRGALLTGVSLLSAILLTGPAYVTEEPRFLFAAFCAWAITFPASAVYRLPAGFPRSVQVVALIAFIGCATGAFLYPRGIAGGVLFGACVAGCVISARLTVGPIARNPMNRR